MGSAATRVSLPDARHELVTFPKAGFATLVVFGSHECGPCKQLFPDLASWALKHRDDVAVVMVEGASGGISLDTLRTLGPQVEVVWGSHARAQHDYRVRATTFGVLVDAKGIVAAKSLVNNEAHLDQMFANAQGLIDLNGSGAERLSFNGGPSAPAMVAIVLGLVTFLAVYVYLYLRNFSVFAGQGYFGRTDALGRRRTWPRGTLDRAVLRTVNFGQGPNLRYLLLAPDGTPLILFSPRIFEPARRTVGEPAEFRVAHSPQVESRRPCTEEPRRVRGCEWSRRPVGCLLIWQGYGGDEHRSQLNLFVRQSWSTPIPSIANLAV